MGQRFIQCRSSLIKIHLSVTAAKKSLGTPGSYQCDRNASSSFSQCCLQNCLSNKWRPWGESFVWWIMQGYSKTVDVFMHEWRGRACSSICHIWKPRCRSQCNPSFTLLWPPPILSPGQCDNHLSNSMKPGSRLKVILHPKVNYETTVTWWCSFFFNIHFSCPQYCRFGPLRDTFWVEHQIIFNLC